jgi:uncharacterized repeat protein (TIGR03803 family)
MTASALAQTETVLHSFTGTDGTAPILSLVFDHAGTLYGVTTEGGSSNNGTVFELLPRSNGTWSVTTLHSFDGGKGGSTPLGGLVLDSAGNLYGTTKLGGITGVGVVFRLSKSSSGWTETVLHSFGGGGDGRYPSGNLVLDAAGNLYGTTQGGGAYSNGTNYSGGTAYQVSPTSGGAWTETVLHSFGNGTDGLSPRANLTLDKAGNLYGTTITGGTNSYGTVFELSLLGGNWSEKVLYSFDPFNGQTDGTRWAVWFSIRQEICTVRRRWARRGEAARSSSYPRKPAGPGASRCFSVSMAPSTSRNSLTQGSRSIQPEISMAQLSDGTVPCSSWRRLEVGSGLRLPYTASMASTDPRRL